MHFLGDILVNCVAAFIFTQHMRSNTESDVVHLLPGDIVENHLVKPILVFQFGLHHLQKLKLLLEEQVRLSPATIHHISRNCLDCLTPYHTL